MKDPVAFAAGRLSHAIRHEHGEEVITLRRRELAGAQIEKYLAKALIQRPVPTREQVAVLCRMLQDAAGTA